MGKVRPTMGKVKKALFDILGPLVAGSEFLDLFAGTGSVGFEALRRGAEKVVFVEINKDLIRKIKEEIARSWCGKAIAIRSDAISAIRRLSKEGYSFNIIFMDPPYGGKKAEEAIYEIISSNLIRNDGIVVVEHGWKEDLGERFGDLIVKKRERYGDTALSFFVKEGEVCQKGA